MDEEGHSCQGRQESSMESNHSITLCPRLSRSCPNTQTLLLGPHIKAGTAAVISPALHRRRLCITNPGKSTVIHQLVCNLEKKKKKIASKTSRSHNNKLRWEWKYWPQTQFGFLQYLFIYYYFRDLIGQTVVILSIFLRVLSKLTKGSTEADCGGSVAQSFPLLRSGEVWGRMTQVGLNTNINYRSVKYGIFQEKLSSQIQELDWRVIYTVVVKLWRTRCVVVEETNVHPQWDCCETSKNWPEKTDNTGHKSKNPHTLVSPKPTAF